MALPVLKLFTSNERVFGLTMEGITHAESLVCADNCNTINWITGHIACSRNSMMKLLTLPPVAGETIKAIYERGAKMMDITQAHDIEELKQIITGSNQAIIQGVEKVKDDVLMEKLIFAGFHETYHIGQLGILRKYIGKDGAIK